MTLQCNLDSACIVLQSRKLERYFEEAEANPESKPGLQLSQSNGKTDKLLLLANLYTAGARYAYLGKLDDAMLSSTIVTTLVVPISTTVHSLGSLAWLGSAYLVGQSASQPVYSRLIEIYGRRAGLIDASRTFGIGTLVCGLATRWKWAFLIHVPFVFVAAVLVYFVVKVPTKRVDKSSIRRVDYLGCLTLVVALVLLLLALKRGKESCTVEKYTGAYNRATISRALCLVYLDRKELCVRIHHTGALAS
ncbi:hypothetical protein VTL71DRAFT_3987 [Oculimacula yallundae]|uniref:Uncharacterized protein n=1 Tax=Oculimacula yallundae TaxID=86028 RepID=A0ABR4C5R6_9HELO